MSDKLFIRYNRTEYNVTPALKNVFDNLMNYVKNLDEIQLKLSIANNQLKNKNREIESLKTENYSLDVLNKKFRAEKATKKNRPSKKMKNLFAVR